MIRVQFCCNIRVYRGDWQQGVMHGCGTCIWKDTAAGLKAVEGKFFGDEYVGDVMPCSRDDATDSAVDADMAAYQARSFQVGGGITGQQPAGDITLRTDDSCCCC